MRFSFKSSHDLKKQTKKPPLIRNWCNWWRLCFVMCQMYWWLRMDTKRCESWLAALMCLYFLLGCRLQLCTVPIRVSSVMSCREGAHSSCLNYRGQTTGCHLRNLIVFIFLIVVRSWTESCSNYKSLTTSLWTELNAFLGHNLINHSRPITNYC